MIAGVNCVVGDCLTAEPAARTPDNRESGLTG